MRGERRRHLDKKGNLILRRRGGKTAPIRCVVGEGIRRSPPKEGGKKLGLRIGLHPYRHK